MAPYFFKFVFQNQTTSSLISSYLTKSTFKYILYNSREI